MVAVPGFISLLTAGGAEKFNLAGNIIESHDPAQGHNYMYGRGNLRSLFQRTIRSALVVPGIVYERVPIVMTSDKTGVTVFAKIQDGAVKMEIFNFAGVSQGSVTLTSVPLATLSGTILGLTASSVNYCTVTLIDVAGGSERLSEIQMYENALATI